MVAAVADMVAEDMAVVVDTSVEAAAADTSAVDMLWPPPPRQDTSRLDVLWSDLDPVRTS
jgi:hypothetical protein